jgi:hypothetical protein
VQGFRPAFWKGQTTTWCLLIESTCQQLFHHPSKGFTALISIMATFDENTGWQKFVKYVEVPQDQDAMYKVSLADGPFVTV